MTIGHLANSKEETPKSVMGVGSGKESPEINLEKYLPRWKDRGLEQSVFHLDKKNKAYGELQAAWYYQYQAEERSRFL